MASSAAGGGGGSVPISLLREGEGHPVVVELKTGETYQGFLRESEASMNMTLDNVTHTDVDGSKRKIEHILIRGSHVKMVVFPDDLAAAPMFKQVRDSKERAERALAEKAGAKAAPTARSIFKAPGAL